MAINLHIPETTSLKPSITVIGVGGAGGNAVNNMINSKLDGVNFAVMNTDAQSLEHSLADRKIQLGANLTKGLGAGALPEVGRAAAEEAMQDIIECIHGSNMVFITAGMGGGTGTGAAPVVAKIAKEHDILTVGVVTKPFNFEGRHRMTIADKGLLELQQYVDTLIIIPNQNLFRIANEQTTFADAFTMADDVLHAGVRGVTDLMIMPGLINLDFADIRSVMSEMGKAMMGTGEAEGDNRAINAAEDAISNPLLDNCSMKGARGVLINITGGMDMTLFEVDEAANRIRDEVDPDANIIFGSTFNEDISGKIRVSVVATGIEDPNEKNINAGYSKKIQDQYNESGKQKKNVLTFDFDEFANTARSQNKSFIPTKPLEPENYQMPTEQNMFEEEELEEKPEIDEDNEVASFSTGIRAKVKSEVEFDNKNTEQPEQKIIHKKAKLSFFERMKNKVLGKEEQVFDHIDSGEENEFDDDQYSTPTFLRKSKDKIET